MRMSLKVDIDIILPLLVLWDAKCEPHQQTSCSLDVIKGFSKLDKILFPSGVSRLGLG
jgi:hypothetical protein